MFAFFNNERMQFNLANYGSVALTLDASDTTRITSVGNLATQWDDKSGRNDHALQPYGSANPITGVSTINGKNVMDFDGTNWFDLTTGVTYSGASGFTMFAVMKPDNTASTRTIFAGLAGSPQLRLDSTHNVDVVDTAVFVPFPGSTPVATGVASLISATAITAGTEVWINGTSTGTDVSDPSWTVPLSKIAVNEINGSGFIGSIAQILIYDEKLSTTAVDSINIALKAKWGIV